MPSRRYYPGTHITEPSYTAEPDWGGLELQRQQDFAQEMRHQGIREDYQRQRMGIPTEAERIVQQQSDARMQAIQAKAQFDAANFEKRYTAKQKAELTRLSAVENEIDNNPNFTEAERVAAHRAVQIKKLGIQPADLPRLSSYPDGQGIGDIWDHPQYGAVTRKPDGSVSTFTPDKNSPMVMAIQNEHNITKQQLADHSAWRIAKLKMISDEVKGLTMPSPTADDPAATRDATFAEKQQFVREQQELWGLEGGWQQPAIEAELQQPGAQPPAVTQQSVSSTDTGRQNASAIIQDAIANPEKMKDPDFAARARAARRFLSQ
jgi:uncharacterized protein (DUF1697 family)